MRYSRAETLTALLVPSMALTTAVTNIWGPLAYRSSSNREMHSLRLPCWVSATRAVREARGAGRGGRGSARGDEAV